MLSAPWPLVEFQKQWLTQAAVSTRKAGPCTCSSPQPPAGGASTGQGLGTPEPSGQKLPLPQLCLAQVAVPAGQAWPLGHLWQKVEAAAGAQVPAAHWVQLLAPGAAEKDPPGQGVGWKEDSGQL